MINSFGSGMQGGAPQASTGLMAPPALTPWQATKPQVPQQNGAYQPMPPQVSTGLMAPPAQPGQHPLGGYGSQPQAPAGGYGTKPYAPAPFSAQQYGMQGLPWNQRPPQAPAQQYGMQGLPWNQRPPQQQVPQGFFGLMNSGGFPGQNGYQYPQMGTGWPGQGFGGFGGDAPQASTGFMAPPGISGDRGFYL